MIDRNKRPLRIKAKVAVGVLGVCQTFSGHRAVIFAEAQLSCTDINLLKWNNMISLLLCKICYQFSTQIR